MPELRSHNLHAGTPISSDPSLGDPAEIVAGSTQGVALFHRLRDLLPRWHRDAACAGHPLEWWFPAKGQSTARAKELCRDCLVRDECLAEAIADPLLDFGIRAGLNVPERKQLRRELKARQGGATGGQA